MCRSPFVLRPDDLGRVSEASGACGDAPVAFSRGHGGVTQSWISFS